jgi:hypothetical protein
MAFVKYGQPCHGGGGFPIRGGLSREAQTQRIHLTLHRRCARPAVIACKSSCSC